MNCETAKQFLLLKGVPILMHTLKKFSHLDKIILVLPEDQMPLLSSPSSIKLNDQGADWEFPQSGLLPSISQDREIKGSPRSFTGW